MLFRSHSQTIMTAICWLLNNPNPCDCAYCTAISDALELEVSGSAYGIDELLARLYSACLSHDEREVNSIAAAFSNAVLHTPFGDIIDLVPLNRQTPL